MNTRLDSGRIVEILGGQPITTSEMADFLLYVSDGNETTEHEIELLKMITSGATAMNEGDTMNNQRPILTQQEIDLLLNASTITNKGDTMNEVNTTIEAAVNNELTKEISKLKVDSKALITYYKLHKDEILNTLTPEEFKALGAKMASKKVDLPTNVNHDYLLSIFIACQVKTIEVDPEAELDRIAAEAEAKLDKAAAEPKTLEQRAQDAAKGARGATETTVKIATSVITEVVKGAWTGLFGPKKNDKIKIR